jgi:hypothetical protein
MNCPKCGEDWSDVAVVRNAKREARPDTAALDVERLAKALARRTDHTDAWVLLPKQMQDLWRKDAAAIAREYTAIKEASDG